jgi:hypothetical protein
MEVVMALVEASGKLPGTEGWTYDAVEERLVEVMALWRRAPDRERGWLHVKAMWPDGRPEVDPLVDYADRDAAPRALPLTRRDIAMMEECDGWIGRWVPERDWRLVGMALGWKASGRRVPWRRIKHQMGIPFGEGGLTRRYERAIGAIAMGLDKDARRGGSPAVVEQMADFDGGHVSSRQ